MTLQKLYYENKLTTLDVYIIKLESDKLSGKRKQVIKLVNDTIEIWIHICSQGIYKYYYCCYSY